MRIIAHRGLIHGPDPVLENTPKQIMYSLNQGYDAEIDVWYDDGWWLGHDTASYRTSIEFLSMDNLWIHAKNLQAATKLLEHTKHGYNLNFFWHDKDDRTLTSHGFWWTDPYKELSELSIWVMPEWQLTPQKLYLVKNSTCYGICTDYAAHIKDILGKSNVA